MRQNAASLWQAGTMNRFAIYSGDAKAMPPARKTPIGDMGANAGRN